MDKATFFHRKTKKAASLKMKLFTYFALYFIIVIGLLFFFQVNYLEKTYELSRIIQIRRVARYVCDHKHISDNIGMIEKKAAEYNAAIIIITEDSQRVLTVNTAEIDYNISNMVMANLANITKDTHYQNDTFIFIENDNQILVVNSDYLDLAKKFKFNSKGVFFITEATDRFNRKIKVITYGSIAPVQATVIAIREQIYAIAVVMFILSVLLSMVIYRTISNPIKEINKKTKEITKGNYNVVFKQNDYEEIQELANSLNNMTEQLSRVEKMQKELIANVSHDLRTPLTMISGYGEVIRDIPNENTQENIQVIIDEANRLSKLVNNMLDASKLEATETILNIKSINVQEFIYEIYNSYSKMLESQGYHIILNCLEKQAYINADYIKLQQVLQNLINNAIKYGGEDKTVIINVEQRNKVIRFEIVDHGQGISEEQLPLIWNRYYKVDRNNTRSYDGSGLGLSIVKKILELHNVNYGVISQINKGTTFYFEFTLNDK